MDAAGSKLDALLSAVVVAPEEPKASAAPTDDGAPGHGDGTTPEDKSAKPEADDAGQAGDPAKVETTEEGKVEEPPDADLEPEKILAKYQTQEDKDKALVESQRFIARLKSENAELKQGKTKEEPPKPATPAAPPAEEPSDVREWFTRVVTATEPEKVQKLTPIERQIQGRFRELETEKASQIAVSKEIDEMETKEKAIDQDLAKLRVKLEGFSEVLKEDPEDFTAKTRVEALERQINEKSNELQGLTIKRMDKVQRLVAADERLRGRIAALDLDVMRVHGSQRAEVESRTNEDKLYETKNAEWKKALTQVLDVESKDELSADEKKIVVKLLQKDLADLLEDPKADYPADMPSWIRNSPSFKEFKAARKTSPASVAREVGDVAPKAPKDSSVPQAPPGDRDKTTFRQGLKRAEANFDRLLRNARV